LTERLDLCGFGAQQRDQCACLGDRIGWQIERNSGFVSIARSTHG
jgi:hypothetical protein